MPVKLRFDVATLSGVVSVDDAEPLSAWLRSCPSPQVRMTRCTHLHTAALQALLAYRPKLGAAPTDPFLARWVVPLLNPETVAVEDDDGFPAGQPADDGDREDHAQDDAEDGEQEDTEGPDRENGAQGAAQEAAGQDGDHGRSGDEDHPRGSHGDDSPQSRGDQGQPESEAGA